jgi:hypothetical protein
MSDNSYINMGFFMNRTLFGVILLLCFVSRLWAETDEEMIKRVGLDPRAFTQGQFDPGKLPGLAMWLKADTGVTLDSQGRVSAWGDPVRGISVAQKEDSKKPLIAKTTQNGLPAIRFSARPDWTLSNNEFTPGGKSFSVITVARVASSSFYGSILNYGFNDKNYAPPFRFGQFSTSGKLMLGNGVAERSESVSGRGFLILQVDYDTIAQRYTLYENGNIIGIVNHSRELPVTGPVTIGGMLGDIAEMMVFNTPYNTATRTALTQYLQKKYGFIAGKHITPLAASLPYAYYPSSNEIEVAFDKESSLLREYFNAVPRQSDKPAATEAGIGYAYFTDLPDSKQLPDFSKLTPKKTGVTAELSQVTTTDGTTFDSDHKKPAIILFKGYLDVPQTGVYTFYLRQYGVAQLFISDRLVIDQLSGHYGPLWKKRGGAIALSAGKHTIDLAAKIFGNISELPKEIVTWSIAGKSPAAIPANLLSHVVIKEWKLPTSIVDKDMLMSANLEQVKQVDVRIVGLKDGVEIKSFTLPLDAGGRGQARFKIPELADGEYAVDWMVGGKLVRSPITFIRRHFLFEKNELGLEHKIYPPFKPVEVKEKNVVVVDRNYTINSLGIFDSVISKGKEMLAVPMVLVAEDTDGKRITWQHGQVTGNVLYPDLAEFTGNAVSSVGTIKSTTRVEEDGCAKVTLKIEPGKEAAVVQKLYLEVTFRDEDVPLFHYTGNDSMRHNYAGKTPRGGKISWLLDQGWVPCIWKAEPGPNDGIIWDSTQIKHWTPGNRDNFCPYIWLGAEDRGLAWFAGTDYDYVNDGLEPVQVLSREGDKVVLRIYFIQQPTLFDKTRQYTFGLQASPTKPLRTDWRSHQVPGGSGVAVNVWGGYLCSDKYPDGADFTIVDKVQEARKTGKVDEAWFKEKDKNRAWSDMKIQFDGPWLPDVVRFAGRGAADFQLKNPGMSSATYFEEHVQDTRYPEWQVFQDEWSVFEFNRFQQDDGSWSQAARSYRDFVLYFANEWMKRGVSMYFDNTYHRVVTNPYNQDFIGRTTTIWEQRDYYKRIWKRLTALNITGESPYELDFTGHITNTQTIPCNTWFTSTLDLEQAYRMDKTRPPRIAVPGDASWMSKGEGYRLPFPPDYTRAMTMGRTVGVIPHIMFPLPNWGDYRDQALMKMLSDANWNTDIGMQLVHEIKRPGQSPTWGDGGQGRRLLDYLAWFGYGSTKFTTNGKPEVIIHNYWEDKPFVSVNDNDIKWLALSRNNAPIGMLLLQSYKEEPATIKVRFPGGTMMRDMFTHEVLVCDEKGEIAIQMPGVYGTRLFLISNDIIFDDFECGVSGDFRQNRSNIENVIDEKENYNHVLRIKPGHPGHERLLMQNPDTIPGDGVLSFRFRLPVLPDKPGTSGLLDVNYRYSKYYPTDCGYDLRLQVQRNTDGTMTWIINTIRALREGKEEKFTEIGANLVGKPIPTINVDNNWHRLVIDTRGKCHTIRMDNTVIFEGVSDASIKGGFSVGPGWGWDLPIPYVEIDDLRFQGQVNVE